MPRTQNKNANYMAENDLDVIQENVNQEAEYDREELEELEEILEEDSEQKDDESEERDDAPENQDDQPEELNEEPENQGNQPEELNEEPDQAENSEKQEEPVVNEEKKAEAEAEEKKDEKAKTDAELNQAQDEKKAEEKKTEARKPEEKKPNQPENRPKEKQKGSYTAKSTAEMANSTIALLMGATQNPVLGAIELFVDLVGYLLGKVGVVDDGSPEQPKNVNKPKQTQAPRYTDLWKEHLEKATADARKAAAEYGDKHPESKKLTDPLVQNLDGFQKNLNELKPDGHSSLAQLEQAHAQQLNQNAPVEEQNVPVVDQDAAVNQNVPAMNQEESAANQEVSVENHEVPAEKHEEQNDRREVPDTHRESPLERPVTKESHVIREGNRQEAMKQEALLMQIAEHIVEGTAEYREKAGMENKSKLEKMVADKKQTGASVDRLMKSGFLKVYTSGMTEAQKKELLTQDIRQFSQNMHTVFNRLGIEADMNKRADVDTKKKLLAARVASVQLKKPLVALSKEEVNQTMADAGFQKLFNNGRQATQLMKMDDDILNKLVNQNKQPTSLHFKKNLENQEQQMMEQQKQQQQKEIKGLNELGSML